MKRYPLKPIYLLLVVAIIGGLVVARGVVAADAPRDKTTPNADQIANLLREDGFTVHDASLADGVLTLAINIDAPDPDRLKTAVRGDLLYKTLAQSGVESVDITGTRWDGSVYRDQSKIWANNVARAPLGGAKAAVQQWVETTATQWGVVAKLKFDDAEYQADIELAGNVDEAAAAAEAYMNGSRTLHEQGFVEVVTVAASSNGELLFQGLSDWVSMRQIKAFEASGVVVEF